MADAVEIPLNFALLCDHGHVVTLALSADVEEWLEVDMPAYRRDIRGGRAFAYPLLGIFVLLASYWLLGEWQKVPMVLSAAFSALHWPS